MDATGGTDIGQGVCLRLSASFESIAVVGAVATGAAEALGLQLEPTVRLQTIAVEAAGNVVAHAYPSGGGAMKIEIYQEDAHPGEAARLHIRVDDDGMGLQVPPGGGHPPGLGLSMISSLAESFTLTSGVAGGTSLDATIVPDAAPAVRGAAPASDPGGSELRFSDDDFVQPVLGRALAAEVSAERTPLDRVEEAIELGDAIAAQLRPAAGASDLPVLSFRRLRQPGRLAVSVGPLVNGATERLGAALRSGVGARIPGLGITTGSGAGGGSSMLLTLPV